MLSAMLSGATFGPQRLPVRIYHRPRYEGAANLKACIKRRAKNKQARKSRQRNRRAFR